MNTADKLNSIGKNSHYVNKWIARGYLIILVLLFIYGLSQSDWSLKPSFYFECPSDSPAPCMNPLYTCNGSYYEREAICDYVEKHPLDMDDYAILTSKGTLEAGEVLGNKPNWFMSNLNGISIVLLLIAILINHGWYKRK